MGHLNSFIQIIFYKNQINHFRIYIYLLHFKIYFSLFSF
jgi:hypothetical protein